MRPRRLPRHLRHIKGTPEQWAATEKVLASQRAQLDQQDLRRAAIAAGLKVERAALKVIQRGVTRLNRALARIAREVDAREKGVAT